MKLQAMTALPLHCIVSCAGKTPKLFKSFFLKLFLAKRSSKWPKVRHQFLNSAAPKQCAACGKSSALEVHHIHPVHLYPELELDPNNLIILCENLTLNCHLSFGHLGNWEAWNPTVVIDAATYNEKVNNRKTTRFPQ